MNSADRFVDSAAPAISLLVPAAGVLHAKVNAVALPDNGGPPHSEILDRSWDIPLGSAKYGNPSDGSIVTQGYPHNGGSHSWEYLTSECTVTKQDGNPDSVQLTVTAISDLNSGVGRNTGASSDFDTEWFVLNRLPLGKPWSMQVTGVINASGCVPTCSLKLNNGQARPIRPGPFIETFENLSGTVALFVAISQGHIAIFPQGPRPTTGRITVVSDVTVSFSRL